MFGEKDLDKSLSLPHAFDNEGAQTEIYEYNDNVPNFYPLYEEPTIFLTNFQDYDKWCDSEVAKGYPTQKEFAD